MHFQVRVDTVDILDDRKQVRRGFVDIEIVQRCVTAGIIEAVGCVHALVSVTHDLHEVTDYS